jgi:hypothetical protein
MSAVKWSLQKEPQGDLGKMFLDIHLQRTIVCKPKSLQDHKGRQRSEPGGPSHAT